MKTFFEEYGKVIIVAIIIVALIGVAIIFRDTGTKSIRGMLDNFLTRGDSTNIGGCNVSDSGSGEEKKEEVKTFTFTIDGNQYTAKENMSWTMWVDSSYNTGGYTIEYDTVCLGGDLVSTEEGSAAPEDVVGISQTITKNGVYYTVWAGCCFDPGTKITMADGTMKNIEDVRAGDYVKSLDEKTGKFVNKKVTELIVRPNSDDLVYLNLANGVRIGMRSYHPLLTMSGWASMRPNIAKLTLGDDFDVDILDSNDVLVGYSGCVKIVSIVHRPQIENYTTYNLEVEDTHNYLANGIVAHNCAA